MTACAQTRSGAERESGFSLTEALVATALMLLVAGALFGLVAPNLQVTQAQPTTMDLPQRARVAADALLADVGRAGAGFDIGPPTGSLSRFFAPLVPRRVGPGGADPYVAARSDAVTVYAVQPGPRQTQLAGPLGASGVLEVAAMPTCPPGEWLCGFRVGRTLLVFDEAGHYDLFAVTAIGPLFGQVSPLLTNAGHTYPAGAFVAEADVHTYYFDPGRQQLRHDDGLGNDMPVVDGVVGLDFRYLGDARPPRYPRPPLGTANCLYDAAGGLLGGLVSLGAGGNGLVELPTALFTDGPWCGTGELRYDADVLRIRQVDVTLTVQAAPGALRGTGSAFLNPGSSRSALRRVPDYRLVFAVAPRNLRPRP